MSTKIKVEYIEQSKCIVANTSVESDTLGKEDILKLAREIALESQAEARAMTMRTKL